MLERKTRMISVAERKKGVSDLGRWDVEHRTRIGMGTETNIK